MKGARVMHPERMKFAAPIIVVMLGVSWLLDTWDVAAGVNWVLTVGLATGGICVLVVGGIDKLTVVVGPFLIAVSACRLLLQIGSLAECVERPIYVIVLGCLLLFAQVPRIPTPSILKRDSWPDE
jgi:hypothetical protein